MKFRLLAICAVLPLITACSQASEPIEETNDVRINLDDYLPEKPIISSPMLISEHSIDGTRSYAPPPSFPPRAEKSGRCRFILQVNDLGVVETVIEIKCSDDIFEKTARNNLMRWRFHPKKDEKGQNIPFKYGPQNLIYNLTDADGNVVPE